MNISTLLSHSTDLLSRIHNLKKEDIHTLREVIREHNRLYYQEESPLISDLEYDQLYHGLARAEVEYGDMDPESPTAHIAVLASAQFKKVSHKYPMISLDNTYSVSDVRDWNDRMMRILQKETQNVTPPNLPLSVEA
jgi:DNA ligase (NAD+)